MINSTAEESSKLGATDPHEAETHKMSKSSTELQYRTNNTLKQNRRAVYLKQQQKKSKKIKQKQP